MQVDSIFRSARKKKTPKRYEDCGLNPECPFLPCINRVSCDIHFPLSKQRIIHMALLFINGLASSSIKQQELWGKFLQFPHSEKEKNKTKYNLSETPKGRNEGSLSELLQECVCMHLYLQVILLNSLLSVS